MWKSPAQQQNSIQNCYHSNSKFKWKEFVTKQKEKATLEIWAGFRPFCIVDVGVQFYPLFNFYFPLFFLMLIYYNKYETKENKNWTKDKIKLQHWQNQWILFNGLPTWQSVWPSDLTSTLAEFLVCRIFSRIFGLWIVLSKSIKHGKL